MKDLLDRWLDLKNKEREAKELREECEAEIYMLLKNEIPDDGQSNWIYDNYKLTIKQNYSITVDQEKAQMFPNLFKTKYELSWAQYKKSEFKNTLDNIVTIKSNKPNFQVEMR